MQRLSRDASVELSCLSLTMPVRGRQVALKILLCLTFSLSSSIRPLVIALVVCFTAIVHLYTSMYYLPYFNAGMNQVE